MGQMDMTRHSKIFCTPLAITTLVLAIGLSAGAADRQTPLPAINCYRAVAISRPNQTADLQILSRCESQSREEFAVANEPGFVVLIDDRWPNGKPAAFRIPTGKFAGRKLTVRITKP